MPPRFAVLRAREGGWPSVVAAAFAWLSVVQSFPLVGAVLFAGLTLLLLADAWSLLRRPS